MSLTLEWRLNDIERTANEAKRRTDELSSIRSDVDNLERAVREARTEIDGLRAQLQTAQSQIESLTQP